MNPPSVDFKTLCEKYSIGLLIAFGSFGTGRFRGDSDIDLAVLAQDAGSLMAQKDAVMAEFAVLFGHRPVDLILLNRADPLLKFEVAKTGRVIHEASPGLFSAFSVRAMQEYNDAKKFFRLDKDYIQAYLSGGGSLARYRPGPPQVKQIDRVSDGDRDSH